MTEEGREAFGGHGAALGSRDMQGEYETAVPRRGSEGFVTKGRVLVCAGLLQVAP
jgi:hypothetical protein